MVTTEQINKVDAIVQAIPNLVSKSIEANINWTHIKAINEEGDMFEITFTPKRTSNSK